MERREFRGERLKYARIFRGKSLTELANESGISKQLISQYENGDSRPSHERLFNISEILHFPYDFFMQSDLYSAHTEATYFRSLMSAKRMERAAQSYRLEIAVEIYKALQDEYIDFEPLRIPTIEFSGVDSETDEAAMANAADEIEQIANTLREYWKLGDGPIENLQFVLESNGIIVTGFPTAADGIDAFSQRTYVSDRDVYAIAVDQGDKPEGRIRFDLAHELGHILLHPWSESLDMITKEEFKIREKQANLFSSAFLLPAGSFRNDAQAYPTDLKYYLWLKKKWHVSVAAMLYRAHQLHIITDNQFGYLMRQYSKNGWRKGEPDDSPFLLNDNVFQGAIDTLFEEHVLTPVTFMRFLKSRSIDLFPDDVEEILHLRKGTLDVEETKPRIVRLKLL